MSQPSRKIEMLFIENIEVRERLRPVDDAAVERLAASIETLGLRTPISVRYYADRPASLGGDLNSDALILMTGLHRLAAAKRLGWERIECFVYEEGDEIDAELWEIAENLHRADLTSDQRKEHIRRYAELLDIRDNKTTQVASFSQGGNGGPGRGHKSDAARVAADLGVSKDTVRRALNPERARVEHEKNADRQVLRAEAEEKLAELLAECVPGQYWDALKANLHAAGCRRVADEFQRLVGVSVFDRSDSGSRVNAEANLDRDIRRRQRFSEDMEDHVALSAEAAALGLINPASHEETKRIAAALDRKFGAGVVDPVTGEIHDHELHEASSTSAPQGEAVHSQGTGAETLAGREGRSEGQAVSAALPTHSPDHITDLGKMVSANQSEAQPVEQSGQRWVDDGGIVVDRPLPVGNAAPNKTAPIRDTVLSLRPHCQNPDTCASAGGKSHCFQCRKAAWLNDVEAA